MVDTLKYLKIIKEPKTIGTSLGILFKVLNEGVVLPISVLDCLTVLGIGSIGSSSFFSWIKGTEGLT
jgi:hypothetical protein